MKTANQITGLMVVLATISVAGAMYFYPWPEVAVAEEEVGKPLFEDYRADQVRGIDIVQIDAESRTPVRIHLERRAERWLVPSRQNFMATNSSLVGNVVNSLNNRTVHDVISENAEDHIRFGVIDPDEFSIGQNLSAIGQKLVLTDRNNKKIADLIVGSPLKDDPTKHYVRIPGKPRIYLIDFNDEILKTKFTYWVSPNPLQLKTSETSPGLNVTSLRIQKVRPSDGDPSDMAMAYDARVKAGQQRIEIEYLRVPTRDPQQADKKLQTTAEQESRLMGAIQGLYPLLIDDVRRKKQAAANIFQKQEQPPELPPQVVAEFSASGFYSPTFDKSGWNFMAENGTVTISTQEGVLIKLDVGSAGNQNSLSKARFNRFAMIHAGVDYDHWKEPQRPAGLADDDSEANKKFRRQLENRRQNIKAAESIASDMNALHANWFYLISEDIVQRLLPEIPIPEIPNPDRSDAAEGGSVEASEGVDGKEPADSAVDDDTSENADPRATAVDKQ